MTEGVDGSGVFGGVKSATGIVVEVVEVGPIGGELFVGATVDGVGFGDHEGEECAGELAGDGAEDGEERFFVVTMKLAGAYPDGFCGVDVPGGGAGLKLEGVDIFEVGCEDVEKDVASEAIGAYTEGIDKL